MKKSSLESGKSSNANSGQEKSNKPFFNKDAEGSFFTKGDFFKPTVQMKRNKDLPEELQSKMESSFGESFSDVEINKNAKEADDLNAIAFTQGESIHFGTGKFHPNTKSGQELIGHELSHVVQQREGKVHSTHQEKGYNVNSQKHLEVEADSQGKTAASGGKINGIHQQKSNEPSKSLVENRSSISQKKVIQKVGHLAAAGAWLAANAEAIGSATAILGAAQSAGGAVGGAMAPGVSGVQTCALANNWLSNIDKSRLRRMTHQRIINQYVDWLYSQRPELFNSAESESNAQESGANLRAPNQIQTPDQNQPTEESVPQSENPTPTNAVNEAINNDLINNARFNNIRDLVYEEIQTELNNNIKSGVAKTYIWSDSGAHTADAFGTVGAVRYIDVQGSYLTQNMGLSAHAEQIPNLRGMPGMSGSLTITQFRGGSMGQSPQMSIGWGDSLGINLTTGGFQDSQQGNGGHATHRYTLQWNWDGNSTTSCFTYYISENGMPAWEDPVWGNDVPDDNSWF